jgi:succinate dehydrogenase/fumarate reductase cytochrome b subunit
MTLIYRLVRGINLLVFMVNGWYATVLVRNAGITGLWFEFLFLTIPPLLVLYFSSPRIRNDTWTEGKQLAMLIIYPVVLILIVIAFIYSFTW